MRRIVQRKPFRADLKRQRRRGRDVEELIAVVELLAELSALPPAYQPHRLSGEWSGVWECHIEPDWLLMYTVTEEEVRPAVRLGADEFLSALERRLGCLLRPRKRARSRARLSQQGCWKMGNGDIGNVSH